MSTHKHIDLICVAVILLAVVITVLFINGEALGISLIVDADSETYEDGQYFTENDLNSTWNTDDACTITLSDSESVVSGNGAYINEGNLVISSSGKYVISGKLSDGSIVVDADKNSKVWILLSGVELSCSDDAAVRVNQAEKVFLTLAENTENKVVSGDEYSAESVADKTDGAIFSHDDLTINGNGSLTVEAGYKHGIAANDDLVITGGNISVSAKVDGIRANDRLNIANADITVNAEDDGIVVAGDEGSLYIESGKFTINSQDDAINVVNTVTVSGGEFEISAGDDGIHSDTEINISAGTINISKCYEGIEAPSVTVSGGDITIYPTDDGINANGGSNGFGNIGGNFGNIFGKFKKNTDTSSEETTEEVNKKSKNTLQVSNVASNNNQTPGNFGGGGFGGNGGMTPPNGNDNFDPSEIPSGEMPDMSDIPQMPDTENGEMPDMSQMPDMQNGETPDTGNIPNMGNEQKTDTDNQTDNSDSDDIPSVNISGGKITIINETGTDADGIDSNGNISITGGEVYVMLKGNGSNCALDYGSENGGVCTIDGGIVIAAGGSSMFEEISSNSKQQVISCFASVEENSVVEVKNSNGETVISYTVPVMFSSVVLSSDKLVDGENYSLVLGETSQDVTLSGSVTTVNMGSSTQSGFDFKGGNGKNASDISKDTSGTDNNTSKEPNDIGNDTNKETDKNVSDEANNNVNKTIPSTPFGDSQGQSDVPALPEGETEEKNAIDKKTPESSQQSDKDSVNDNVEADEEVSADNKTSVSKTELEWVIASIIVLVVGLSVTLLYRKKA